MDDHWFPEPQDPWDRLQRALNGRYGPVEAQRRFNALVDGTSPDLASWRSLGSPKRARG